MLKALDYMRSNAPVLYADELTDESLNLDPTGYLGIWMIYFLFEVPIILIAVSGIYCDLAGIPYGK